MDTREPVVYLLVLFAYGRYEESLCCSEFQRCQFLQEEMSECGEDMAVCVTSHQALASSQQLGIGHIFLDPESELETPAKAHQRETDV